MAEMGLDVPAQSHLHRCQKCGTVWGHGNMMQRDVEAHTCPKCGGQGKENWRVYRGGGSPTEAPAVYRVTRPGHLLLFEYAALVAMLLAVGYFALVFWREWWRKA